jgi:hypothetical protein
MTFKKIEFETEEEMEDHFRGGNYKFSKLVVDTILKNLNNKDKDIQVLEIFTRDTGTVYDISIEKNTFKETLEANLKTMERFEDYERCSKIVEAVKFLDLN